MVMIDMEVVYDSLYYQIILGCSFMYAMKECTTSILSLQGEYLLVEVVVESPQKTCIFSIIVEVSRRGRKSKLFIKIFKSVHIS